MNPNHPNTLTDTNGISPVIGVILLVAITVILTATIGTFVLELGGSLSTNPQAGVDIQEGADGVKISLNTLGGETEKVEVLVNGSLVEGATLDSVGQQIVVGVPENSTVSVRGITTSGEETLLTSIEASQSYSTSGVILNPTQEPDFSEAPSNLSTIIDDMEGSGTDSDPYVITNVYELQSITADKGASYVLGNDIDASDTSEWNDGNGFNSIGDASNPFTGKIDGEQYTVTGLTIDRGDYTGLFGANSGSISNIGIVNADISGSDFVGTLVGENDGSVSKSYSTGSITGVFNVGGLVGRVDNGQVTNSYSKVDASGYSQIGGLVGHNMGSVSKSYSVGNVVGWNDNEYGGVVGENWGTISDSYWDSDSSDTSSNTGETELTTSEMQGSAAKTNMAGLDFTNIWTVSEGEYPHLQSDN